MGEFSSSNTTTEKAPLRFRDLANLAGAKRFSAALGGSSSDTIRVRDLANIYLQEDESLGDIIVGKIPKGATYDIERDRIGVSSADPDILAHETEHAMRLRKGSGSLYNKILGVSKQVVELNNLAAIPAILGLRTLIKDREERNNILKVLAGMSLMAAAPNLLEEARASTRVVAASPDKVQSIKRLFPAFAQHAGYGMVAPGLYLAGTKVEDLL